MYIINLLYAQETQQITQSNPLVSFMPIILIFVIFYFLLILPQQKREKKHKEMLNNLKKGDYILTSGGIYGTIINIKPDIIELKVDDNTKLQLAKTAVIELITKTL